MSKLLIQGGRIIDPSQQINRVADLVLCDGKIEGIDIPVSEPDAIVDAKGKIVCPGLVDMHVHLREPGREEDETIATGTAAAVAGGVTSMACMPNTEPAIDNQAAAEFIYLQAARAANANVYPIGTVSKGRSGQELAEMGGLVEGGAVAFSDDGDPVSNSQLMRRALEYASMLDKAVFSHCEIKELTVDGVMHEGDVSLKLGLPGLPAVAEEIMVNRDIALAELTGGRLHILHASTAGTVDLVRNARRRGISVTTEACPHNFILTDECLERFDSDFIMYPPLRAASDVEAIIEGLVDGTIEVIATDHAPHAVEKKMKELDHAPFGVMGLETLIPICIRALIEPGHLSWPALIEKLTVNPAKLLGINKGTLQSGVDGDVTIIDPDVPWTVDPKKFHSKSRNSPFKGWEVSGRAYMTIVGGETKYRVSDVED